MNELTHLVISTPKELGTVRYFLDFTDKDTDT